MYKITGICTGICKDGVKSIPKTIYCVDFSDILYGCAGAGIDLIDHYIKIEYIDFKEGEDE